MEIKVEKLTDQDLLQRVIAFAYDRESKQQLDVAYKRMHTIVRTQLFIVWMKQIPTKVSVHFVRHSQTGQFHLAGSNRADWKLITAPNEAREHDEQCNRLTPVNHVMILNAQHLVDMSKQRLCMAAEKDTVKVMGGIRCGVAEVDSGLALMMRPKCYWSGGFCQEGKHESCRIWKSGHRWAEQTWHKQDD